MIIRLLVAAPIILFVVGLLVGAVTGRVRLRSCCAVADPTRDTRTHPAA